MAQRLPLHPPNAATRAPTGACSARRAGRCAPNGALSASVGKCIYQSYCRHPHALPANDEQRAPSLPSHPDKPVDDAQNTTPSSSSSSTTTASSNASSTSRPRTATFQQPTLAASTPPPLRPSVLAAELLSGQLLVNAKRSFPAVPWGPLQLAQVMAWSAALAVLSATTAATTPQAAALLASDELRSAAVRHLGLETLCCCLAAAVLYMGLRRSKPRSVGFFRFDLHPQLALTVAAAAAVSYPLADPVLHEAWSSLEQAVGLRGLLPDPGASLVAQLRACEQAGDGPSVAMHLLASCVIGPLWEETFWRGFFLASMTRVLPLPGCVALSSTAFAALHLGPGNLGPIAALSAVCDVLYLRSGTLAAPLLFHAGWNAYQVAGILLAGKDSFV